jgi:MSHA pilin protein MshC
MTLCLAPRKNSLRQPCRRRVQRVRGFTLIELIMVITIMGALAVFAAPKMFNTDDFYARGFHDETLGLLRYAQKVAVAQRRSVCVTFSAPARAYATLTIASLEATYVCDTALVGPNKLTPSSGSNQFCDGVAIAFTGPSAARGCIVGKSGVSYSTAPAAIIFNGLGQPVDASGAALTTISTVAVSTAPHTISIEPATGYVHE